MKLLHCLCLSLLLAIGGITAVNAKTVSQNFRSDEALAKKLSAFIDSLREDFSVKYVMSVALLKGDEQVLEQITCLHSDLTSDVMLEQLMTLTYSANMSHSEIVEVSEIPLGTVKSHINRAKQKLIQLVTVKETA